MSTFDSVCDNLVRSANELNQLADAFALVGSPLSESMRQLAENITGQVAQLKEGKQSGD